MAIANKITENPKAFELLKTVWGDPLGKFAITATTLLGSIALAGVTFKLAAYAMNNFKDFRAAHKR